MNTTIWLLMVFMAILMWSAAGLLYKADVPKEKHICIRTRSA